MAEFILARDLKKKYKVLGRYYVLKGRKSKNKCRSLLTISDITISKGKRLLVVMLNPGSSRPLNKQYKETEINFNNIEQLNLIPLIDAKPDNTQYQIMRVMNEFQYSNADIINLYDIREPKSKLLFSKAKKGQLENELSIFSEIRHPELKKYFSKDTTVILAWGNTKAIKETEILAQDKITKLKSKTIAVHGNNNLICHPSPLNHQLKIKWLDDIFEQLKAI